MTRSAPATSARASAPAGVAPSPTPVASSAPTPAPRKRRLGLGAYLTILGVLFALLAGAVWASVGYLYRELYSPTAFVERYLGLLVDGRAADALGLSGVTGRLAAGLSADLIAVDGDPTVDLSVLRAPRLVVARGLRFALPEPRAAFARVPA